MNAYLSQVIGYKFRPEECLRYQNKRPQNECFLCKMRYAVTYMGKNRAMFPPQFAAYCRLACEVVVEGGTGLGASVQETVYR